jgi:DNA-binding XRE family transcriptional regulator
MTTTPGFIGQRLIEARRARAISATDFAALVGVSAVSISKYENGPSNAKARGCSRNRRGPKNATCVLLSAGEQGR